jgi:small subunit ribosomal protein S1
MVIMQNNKKRFIPPVDTSKINIADFDSFEQMLQSTNTAHLKEGNVVKGQVVGLEAGVVIVDVGGKNEGRISAEEFKHGNFPAIGDLVDIYIEKIEARNGRTILSREKALREESWVHLEEACKNSVLVDGMILGRVKGGFTVDINGVIAFLPGSQVDVRPIKDISHLMHEPQKLQILKMDKKLGNIVVSRRAILEGSMSEARDEALSKINEGDILEGSVKNITDYGAFVELGAIDGLLHVTDISWSRVNHPSEVLVLGQKVKVKIIKIHPDTKRISLGMKQLEQNPWSGIEQDFPVGTIITGKITNIADYGAFVELKENIEGLVHSSEISWLKSSQNPKKILSLGQEVQVMILEVDVDKHRISLSMKQCQQNPIIKFAEEHKVGDIINVPIRNVTDFALFVAIGENIDGMIHESDIQRDGSNSSDLLRSFKRGELVECKILSIDAEKERVSLGIKQLHEDSHVATTNNDLEFNYKKNDVVTCTVSSVTSDQLEVALENDIVGIIKKSDLSADKQDQRTDRFVVGDRIDAKIIGIDRSERRVTLSIKQLEMDERKRAIKEYGSTDSGASLGDILGAALGEKK